GPSPRLYRRVLWEVGVQDLIPPNHFLAEFLKDLRKVLVEISLQGVVILYSLRFHESLNLWVVVPLFALVFISSDVNVFVSEKLGHFSKKDFQKFVELLTRRVECRFKDPVLALDLIRSGRTAQIRVRDQPACCMARHIELRHDPDTAVAGIGNDFSNLILCVVETVRTQLMKRGIAFRFDSKPL